MLPAARQRSVPWTQLHAVDVAAMSGCLLQLLAGLIAFARCAFEALKNYAVTRESPKSASCGAVMVLSHRMHHLGTNKYAEA
jgi:hypothetical protein